MTLALCFNCGKTKFGAWCPCSCGVSSSGDKQLDIAFSDHYLSPTTIEQFGGAVQAIAKVTSDFDERMLALLRYVSLHHSDILTIDFAEKATNRADVILAQATISPITVEHRKRVGDRGRPDTVVTPSPDLLAAFSKQYPFDDVALVDVLLKEGTELRRCALVTSRGETQLHIRAELADAPEILAMRSTSGCLASLLPFMKKPWIHASGS